MIDRSTEQPSPSSPGTTLLARARARLRDAAWVLAFAVACLALIGVKLLLGSPTQETPRGEVNPPPQAETVVNAPAPTTRPIRALRGQWAVPPSGPTTFTDPNLVFPTKEVAGLIKAATTLPEWLPLRNDTRLETVADWLRVCDSVDDLRPPCVVAPAGGVNPRKVAVLVGDSTVQAYWFMARSALQPRGWTLVSFSLSGCPAAAVTPVRPVVTGRDPGECARHHAAYEAVMQRWQPSLVLVSDSEEQPYSLLRSEDPAPRQVRKAQTRYGAALARTLRGVAAPGRHVVLLSPPPAQRSVATCVAAGDTPAQCQQLPYRSWFDLNRIQRAASERAGAVYADLLPFFCDNLVCPSMVREDLRATVGLAVRGDFTLMTQEYGAFVGSSFSRYLSRRQLL